tara:strand:- start:51 stop:485 length:435 start_codon:yes stop_codon:yes gene_type:complete
MAIPAIVAVARLIASSGVPAAIKKYGVKAVNEAKKHMKDMTTKASDGQKKIAPVTKSQRATRDTGRKALAVGAAGGYAAGRGGSSNEPKAKPKAKEPRANPKDFPKYSKTTKSAVSFREATRAAKRKGQKTFTWEGRRYNTDEK